jgi:UDP-N-acetyl-D-mannosaminuronate dehydrogenase
MFCARALMKMHVVNLAERGLGLVGKRLYGAKIAVMGLAYKKNINDPRESPAIKIIEELVNLGAEVRVYDPFVPSLATKAGVFASVGVSRRRSPGRSARSSSWTTACSGGSRWRR